MSERKYEDGRGCGCLGAVVAAVLVAAASFGIHKAVSPPSEVRALRKLHQSRYDDSAKYVYDGLINGQNVDFSSHQDYRQRWFPTKRDKRTLQLVGKGWGYYRAVNRLIVSGEKHGLVYFHDRDADGELGSFHSYSSEGPTDKKEAQEMYDYYLERILEMKGFD